MAANKNTIAKIPAKSHLESCGGSQSEIAPKRNTRHAPAHITSRAIFEWVLDDLDTFMLQTKAGPHAPEVGSPNSTRMICGYYRAAGAPKRAEMLEKRIEVLMRRAKRAALPGIHESGLSVRVEIVQKNPHGDR
ncbi:MAG TPA: hypothetical protein VLO11_11815 [Luteolibacter sp.]|nr:hypothetical protein [Luteolibacter sp.]